MLSNIGIPGLIIILVLALMILDQKIAGNRQGRRQHVKGIQESDERTGSR